MLTCGDNDTSYGSGLDNDMEATMETITVYQDSDAGSLGPSATQADLDGFCVNLAAHLSARFGVVVEVDQIPGGKRAGRICPANDEIEEYVRELNGGDGWVDLLPAQEDPTTT